MITLKIIYSGVPISRGKESRNRTPRYARLQNVFGLVASQQTSKVEGMMYLSRWNAVQDFLNIVSSYIDSEIILILFSN